jgi:hypothetical protein
MIQRFERDDDGYRDWLTTHPDGWVLNTYMHVTSEYFLLHRAACRTVNRPLSSGRTWTHAYGKTCADLREELEEWASAVGGRRSQACSRCVSLHGVAGSDKPAGKRAAGLRGPRAPRELRGPIAREGAPITIHVDPMSSVAPDTPPLIIEGAQWLAETFFRRDPSAVGPRSFDAWIEMTGLDPDRRDHILDDDVTAVNTTMAARTSHNVWAQVIASDEWGWLRSLDPGWDLIEMPEPDWAACGVPALLATAFGAVQRPGLHVAVVTKVLHIKRPSLIPVLDRLVLDQIGGRVTADVGSWVATIEHLRGVGRQNLAGLSLVRDHLVARGLSGRPLVRILDALLWTSAPGAGLFSRLDQWERVIRPRTVLQ